MKKSFKAFLLCPALALVYLVLGYCAPAKATVATSAYTTTLQGNGVTTSFSYNFLIPYQAGTTTPAVVVQVTNTATGIVTNLSSTAYTISGVGNATGGIVTYAPLGVPLASGNTITITRAVPYTQPTAVLNQSFYPHTIEQIADWLELQIQQLQYEGSTASASSISVGSTSIQGGTSGNIEVNAGGLLGEIGTTGTGNAVLASGATLNSPNLITPNLGTPSAINLTNATGLQSSEVITALGYTPPTPTGSGASGTWGINVTGNAATATTASAAPLSGLMGTGTGVLTAAANPVNTAGGLVTYGGAIGTPTINISAATGLTASQVDTAIGGTPCLVGGSCGGSGAAGLNGQIQINSGGALAGTSTGSGVLAALGNSVDSGGGLASYSGLTANYLPVSGGSINNTVYFTNSSTNNINGPVGTGTGAPNYNYIIGGNGSIQLKASGASLYLGNKNAVNSPFIVFYTSGNGVNDCVISPSGGSTSGLLGSLTFNCNGGYIFNGQANFNYTPLVNGTPLANSSATYSAGSCLQLSGTVFSLQSSCNVTTGYAALAGANFIGPVNGTLESFYGSGWQYLGSSNSSTFPAGTSAGGLGVAWNATGGQAEVDFLNETNLGDPSGFAFYQQPSGTGTPTQIAYLGSTKDTFPEPIYETGSTNTLSCPVNFDSNSPTAASCQISSTVAGGNKSQWGSMISTTTNANSTSGAEGGSLYVANNCLSGAPTCWGMSLATMFQPGAKNGQVMEMVAGNASCDPGVPWAPNTGCATQVSGFLIDGVGNSSAGVYPNLAALYLVNSSAGTIYHAGIMMGNNPGGASSISDAGIADYTQDTTVYRVGNSHTHFYTPQTSTGLVASYSGTMWDSAFTAGDSTLSGAILSATNSAAVCNGTPSTSGFNWSCSSDARLKTDYGLDGDELAYINSLPIDRYKIDATGEITVGPIAQKLQKIHPEMVHEVEDDLIPADKENAAGTMLSVDQPDIWKLTRAIQELHDIVKKQQAEIADLKQREARDARLIASLQKRRLHSGGKRDR
jgi:hypothetical protein